MSSDSINKEYKYYFLNYIHLNLYLIIFILSYYITYTYKFPSCLISSITLGWSLYALVTVGHDCMHKNFSPYPKLNKILSYLFLNGILMPRDVWQEEHSYHHSNPGSPEDGMILDGNNFFCEIKNLLCSKHNTTILKELGKLPLIISLLFLPLYCIPIIWLTTLCSFAYLSLSTHIVEPNIRTMDHNKLKAAEDIALNIFPHSHFFCFLAGGLNIHACHHKNPRWTRQELFKEAKKDGYKEINTIYEFINLLWNRH